MSQTVGIGQTATFTVVGGGTGPLIYQWRKNNASIGGATSASYTTPPATIADDGAKYVVSVGNSFSGATSNVVTLSVPHIAASIVTQPVSQTVSVGQTATFTVVGGGTGPLIYQWRKNNISIAGATSASYTTPPMTIGDDGTKYVVSVGNSFSGATSDVVTLSVPRPTSIVTQPVSQTVGIGQTATFTVVGGGTGPLIYQWRKNNASIAGATSASYTTPPATIADDGAKYVVSVGNSFSGATSGVVTLSVPHTVASIVAQPVSQTVGIGQTATFTVVGGGTGPLIYQWRKNNASIAGATSASYTTPPATIADDGAKYVVSVGNSFSGATSGVATLSVPHVVASIVTQPAGQTAGIGQTATFTVVGGGTGPLIYQWRKNNASIAGATSASYTTPPATIADDGAKYVVSVGNSFSGATSSVVTLSVPHIATSITTQPVSKTVGIGQAATFTVVGGGTGPLIYQWRKNNISIAGATSASYTTPPATVADDGAKYVVSVSNSFSGATSSIVTLSVPHAAASIVTQPASQTVVLGDTATFTVAVAGTAPFRYQWFSDGALIFGATSSTYSTITSPDDDGANITVVVSNLLNSVTSQPAILHLFIPANIVTPPQNQSVGVGKTATFTVVAGGTSALRYQWQKRARGAAIAQDIPGATAPQYVTPPATAADQGSEYTIRVQDTQGDSDLASAMLTVTPTSPAIYYVDYATGDDHNDGTVRSSPWSHAPGMTGCVNLCQFTVLNPGDRVIFKGGVTWGRQAFPMNISSSGTSANPIYFGVDKTWFAGSAWVRPRFDLNGDAFIDSPVQISSADFVTVDNIEIQNALLDVFSQWPALGNIGVQESANVTIENCYIHGWSVLTPVPGIPAAAGIAFFVDAQNGTVKNCVLDGSPGGDTVTAIYGGRWIQDNIIQDVPNAIVVFSDQEDTEISGNRILNIRYSPDPSQTENGIVAWGSARIYNNVIHDLFADATAVSLHSWSSATDQYVYNNVIWNVGSNAAVRIARVSNVALNEFIYNNTIQAGATGCVQVVPGALAPNNLTVENNQCISDQTTLPAWCWNAAAGNASCGPAGSVTQQANVLMTTAVAASQGYTVANSFRPSGASSSTVGAGLNLSPVCASAGVPLCADRLAVARPAGAGAWDAGAYFFDAAAGNQAPLITQDPASRIVAAGQTATFFTVATGTPAPAYQWRKNGVNISGATAASYTTPAASTGDNGAEFTVVVLNGSGSVESGVALLSVRSVPGLLTSTVASINLGNVYVGITGEAQVTLTNGGQIDVAITNVSVAGPGFQASGVPAGTILVPGQTIQLLLDFSPSSAGSASGSVTVTSDSANSPLIISLSGTGVALISHAAILSWIPSSSDVIGYRIYRSAAPAGPYVPLNGGVQPTTNYADLAISAGQTYSYEVTAVDANSVESLPSNQVTGVIPTP